MSFPLVVSLCLLAIGCTSNSSVEPSGQDKVDSGFKNPPKDVHVILRKDGIPAIFEPKFVKANDAKIPDDAYVIGVALGGEARAYSINLLDGHEIVNDVVGGRKIAATW